MTRQLYNFSPCCTWKSFALIRLSKLLFICIALAFNLCCKSRVSPQPYSMTWTETKSRHCKSYTSLYISFRRPRVFLGPIAKQNQQVAHIFQHEAAQAGKPTEISIKMPFVAIASCHETNWELRTGNCPGHIDNFQPSCSALWFATLVAFLYPCSKFNKFFMMFTRRQVQIKSKRLGQDCSINLFKLLI